MVFSIIEQNVYLENKIPKVLVGDIHAKFALVLSFESLHILLFLPHLVSQLSPLLVTIYPAEHIVQIL